MRVVIIGGGIAGKTSACLLKMVPTISNITVLEASDGRTTPSFFTGLWSPALGILHAIDKCLSKSINNHITYINKSGYRTVEGIWLAVPRIGLQPFFAHSTATDTGDGNGPSLGFIQNDILMDALDECLLRVPDTLSETAMGGNGQGATVSIKRNAGVLSIYSHDSDSNACVVQDVNGDTHDADLLIAADGTFSIVRKLLYPAMCDADVLEHRGYKVYRGVCDLKDLQDLEYDRMGRFDVSSFPSSSMCTTINDESSSTCSKDFQAFQTWGEGARVAAVPVHLHSNVEGANHHTNTSTSTSTSRNTIENTINAQGKKYVGRDDAKESSQAVVEKTHSTAGVAWFAAITELPTAAASGDGGANGSCDATTMNTTTNTTTTTTSTTASSIGRHGEGWLQGPFGNGSTRTSHEECELLKNLLGFKANDASSKTTTGSSSGSSSSGSSGASKNKEWHSPIPSLVATSTASLTARTGSSCTDTNAHHRNISVCDAIAFKNPIPGGLSGLLSVYPKTTTSHGTSMDATSSTSSSTSTTTVAAAAGSPVGTGTGTDSGVYARIPVAFVGDAAHTLDPILAQGAGIAVEDAMHLRNAILEVLPAASPNAWNAATDGNATTTTTTTTNQNNSASKLTSNDTIDWVRALQMYETQRARRVQKLHHVSNLAQWIGHMRSPVAIVMRDWCIRFLAPHAIKSRLFDRILRYVAS